MKVTLRHKYRYESKNITFGKVYEAKVKGDSIFITDDKGNRRQLSKPGAYNSAWMEEVTELSEEEEFRNVLLQL